ncbi:MAG: hypothetical protein GX640_04365 [Fibrobacter sp.]|nr:hypothetical protein [Fibrobacter sp.]
MDKLSESVKDFSDEYLLDQFQNHKDDYTEGALKILGEEVERRNLDINKNIAEKLSNKTSKEQIRLDKDDFNVFDHTFSYTDLLLATAVLRENDVIFFVENPNSDTLPLENQAVKRFSICVHKSSEAKAHEILDEHFVKSDGQYSLKNSDIRERLKSFSFHDLQITENDAKEPLDVAFSDAEIRIITGYARRLLSEVDEIEEKQGRVVFYYDAIEPLIELLEETDEKVITRNELLAILEILQIYCSDPGFPDMIDETISALLGFFYEQQEKKLI